MQDYTADTKLADIKILAADMDLTLLADDGTLPEDMEQLIDELAKVDVLFCAASGRPVSRLFTMFPNHLDKMAFVSENGGAVFYKNAYIYKSLIEASAYQKVLFDAEQRQDCAPVLCAFDGAYILERDKALENDFHKYYPVVLFCDSFEHLEADTAKFSLLFPEYNAEPALADYYMPTYGSEFYITNAGREWIDFMNKGSDKGSGVTHLAEHLGISIADVATCGDTYNDIPMLEAAGHSFLMGNAEEHMRAHAKYLLPTNNERGVAVLARAIIEAKRSS